MHSRTLGWVGSLVLALAIVGAGCQRGQTPTPADPGAATAPAREPKRGGSVTVGTERDLSILNPLQRTFSVDEYVRNVMYDALLATDLQDNVQPNLAESWEASRDGLTYTFKLRRGVKFHNGQELTADDVAWSINFILNPKNSAYGRQRILMVDRAEPVDTYTVRAYLTHPHPGFLAAMATLKGGIILPRDSLEEGVTRSDRFPPGTGPFKFVEWQPKQRIAFERFDDYWGPDKALVDKLTFIPIEDDSVRLTAVRAGDIDMMRGTPYDWAKQIKEGQLRGIVGMEAAFAFTKQLAFNVVGSPFEDKRLRQAVAHAINREEMIQGVFNGFADPMDAQNFPKHHKWYIPGIPTIPYDLDRGRALLREAGYNGEPIELLLTPGSEDYNTATVVQEQLRRIGMNVQLKMVDPSAREEFARKGEYHFDLRGGNFFPDISDAYVQDFRCDEKRVSNRTGYCDRTVDELITRADSELDDARRRAMYKEILTRTADDVPYVRLVFVRKPFTLRDYVQGFSVDREGRFRWIGGGMQTTWLDK
jgi:peptide/nickel transport system substrate-binding protein